MQIRIRFIAILTLASALAGCATTMSKKAADIQVHSQMSTLLTSCQKIGPVTATAKAVWIAPTVEAKNIARERVADLGGDTLVVTNIDETSDLTGFVTSLHGVALRCY